MKDQIAQLLNTKMDRKDFLKYAAATGFMAVGGGVILKSVDNLDKITSHSPESTTGKRLASGYGVSAYGRQPVAAR